MEKVGIIACAFGQQGDKEYPLAGPSNKKITSVAWQIYTTENRAGIVPLVAIQWETGIHLPSTYVSYRVSRYGTKTHYVSTKTVLDESIAFFKQHGVKRVVLVGHPLHLFFINLLVKSGAWSVGGITIDHQYDGLMKSIPYDRSVGNVQWWTRNPIAFVAYMAKAFVTKKYGA